MTDEELKQKVIEMLEANLAKWRKRGLGEPAFNWDVLDEGLWYFLQPKVPVWVNH